MIKNKKLQIEAERRFTMAKIIERLTITNEVELNSARIPCRVCFADGERRLLTPRRIEEIQKNMVKRNALTYYVDFGRFEALRNEANAVYAGMSTIDRRDENKRISSSIEFRVLKSDLAELIEFAGQQLTLFRLRFLNTFKVAMSDFGALLTPAKLSYKAEEDKEATKANRIAALRKMVRTEKIGHEEYITVAFRAEFIPASEIARESKKSLDSMTTTESYFAELREAAAIEAAAKVVKVAEVAKSVKVAEVVKAAKAAKVK